MFYLGIVITGDVIEFLLIDGFGRIHGKQVEHHVDLIYDGKHSFRGVIESGIARVCLKADCRFEDISFTYLAVPGFGEHPDYDYLLRDVLNEIFFRDNYLCENDVEAALTAALTIKPGITVLIGAGSVAMGMNKKGESKRSGGWGRIAGDEAGEYWFGKKILEIFTKEADGRYHSKILYNLLKEKLKITNDYDIINFSFEHLLHFDLDFHEFVDLLFQSQVLGDPYAKAAIDQGVEEIALLIQSISTQLDFVRPITISCIGKLFDEEYVLIEKLERYLCSSIDLYFQKPKFSLVTGAALKALMFRKNITNIEILQLLQEEQRLQRLNTV